MNENITIQDLLTMLLYWHDRAKRLESVMDAAEEEAYNIGYVNGRKDAEADQWSEATRE